jgi:hypothetical protein
MFDQLLANLVKEEVLVDGAISDVGVADREDLKVGYQRLRLSGDCLILLRSSKAIGSAHHPISIVTRLVVQQAVLLSKLPFGSIMRIHSFLNRFSLVVFESHMLPTLTIIFLKLSRRSTMSCSLRVSMESLILWR